MSRQQAFWLASGFVCVSMLLMLIWGAVQAQWYRHQALSLYAQGDFRGARYQSEALLSTSPDLPTEGMARVLLAEIALQEQRWDDAETEATTAILRLQQSRHGQTMPGDNPWLKRALSVRILTGLAPVVHITQETFYLYPWALAKVRPFIENAQSLGENRFDRLFSLPEDAYGLGIWKDFVAREPLYGRLREKKITLPVEAKPQTQLPVREVVKRWQAVKAQAFVNLDTDALQTVLTGAALEGSLQAVQWWIDHPDAYYTHLELHALRFLRVSYTSSTSATVVAEVEETRNNSEEGLQKQRYQVEYTLVKMGETWLIDRVKVRNEKDAY